MAHELDINSGVASFVTARTDAWHGLGVTLQDSFTAEEAMTFAHLGGWNVRKAPLFASLGEAVPNGKPNTIALPDKFAVLRDNPINKHQIDQLGVVGESYNIIQNEAHAEFLNTLVDESGAHFETAGALQGGRKVFISMKMPGHMKIGGVDAVDTYLAAINSHDGSMAFTMMATPVRVVCANTLNMAFQNHSHIFRTRHTSGVGSLQHVQKAREVMDLTFSYIQDFQDEANKLINTVLTQAKFEAILEKEFGAPKDAAEATITRAEVRIGEMARLFADAGTQAEIRNTAWAGLNAMTEWYDHFSPTRGATPLMSRHEKALLDPSFKNRALVLMNKVAEPKRARSAKVSA